MNMLMTMIVKRANSEPTRPGADVGERAGDVVERSGRVLRGVLELADQVEVLVQALQRLVLLDRLVQVVDVGRKLLDEVAGRLDRRGTRIAPITIGTKIRPT